MIPERAMSTESPADAAQPFSEDVFQLMTEHSVFFDECATKLAKILWEQLPDDRFVEILALVPDPRARLVPTVAAELLARSPNYGTYDQPQYRELLTAMSIVVVTSLSKELERRAGDRESARDSSVRKWIARGEPTPEELKALMRVGRRRRNDPLGEDETDSIRRAALAEHVDHATRDHYKAPLVEQFRHMLDGFFGKVAWKADNVLRDALRKEGLHQQRELGVDSEQLAALESSATDHNPVFRVEGPERAILLAEVCACPTLTDQERQVTELYLEDLTQVEIAEKLRISQPRASQLQHQAIAKMSEHAKTRP